MSREQELIRREIINREPFKVGTVLGRQRIERFDGAGAGAGVMWVCDVEIGSNRPLLNVPIKAGGDGSRFYALDGAVVLLRRNAAGRWQVVGAGDRAVSQQTTKEYSLETQAQVGGDGLRGTLRVVDPFEFYSGPTALKGNPDLTFVDGAPGVDTITRASGSWLDDGFEPNTGQIIRIGKRSVNQGLRTVGNISDLVLSMVDGGFFTDEGPVSDVSVLQGSTSRWNSPSFGFPSVRLVDATGNTITPS